VTHHIDKKCPAEFISYSFVGEQVAPVEKITRVLAIKPCNRLAGVKVREGDQWHFGKAESFLDQRLHVARLDLKDAAADNGVDLDFDLHAFDVCEQFCDAALGDALVDLTANVFLEAGGNPT